MAVGAVSVGIRPDAVVPRIADAVRAAATVEAADLAVVRGSVQVTVRFTGEDDAQARSVAGLAVAAGKLIADIVTWRITRRVSGQWRPVAPG